MEAEELDAGGDRQPLFLPTPSFMASAEGAWGMGRELGKDVATIVCMRVLGKSSWGWRASGSG